MRFLKVWLAALAIVLVCSIESRAQVNPVYRQDPVTGNATQQQQITVPAGFGITFQPGSTLNCSGTGSCLTSSQDIADVRSYMATPSPCSGTNLSNAVAAAVTAGYLNVFIPANCTYTPPSNTTPDNVTIIGEDWFTTIIAVANRATDDIQIGRHAVFKNVGIISKFCDTVPSPGNTQKVCPIKYEANFDQNLLPATGWAGQYLNIANGPTFIGPTGSSTTDQPIFGMTGFSTGDNIYTATEQGNSVRCVTVGGAALSGGTCLLVLNGWDLNDNNLTTTNQVGFRIKDFTSGTNTNQFAARIDRLGNSVMLRFGNDDASASANQTGDWIQSVISNQASGNIVNFFQTTRAFSGDFFLVNAGNNSGTFSGKFVDYQVAGSSKFYVDGNGSIVNSGTILANGGNIIANAGTIQYLGVAGGTADALTFAPGNPITSLTVGACYTIKAAATNATTTPTANVSTNGVNTAKTIVKRAATAVAAGDIINGGIYQLCYDGTNLQLKTPTVP